MRACTLRTAVLQAACTHHTATTYVLVSALHYHTLPPVGASARCTIDHTLPPVGARRTLHYHTLTTRLLDSTAPLCSEVHVHLAPMQREGHSLVGVIVRAAIQGSVVVHERDCLRVCK